MKSASAKEKAAAKAKAREKARARKAQERSDARPSREYSETFRAEFNRLFASFNLVVDEARLEPLLKELERTMFVEGHRADKGAAVAIEELRNMLYKQQRGEVDPDQIPFKISGNNHHKHIEFTHFLLHVNIHADKKMDFQLDPLPGADLEAFKDIVELAQSKNDGEYYLHGAGAYEWWMTTHGTRPPKEQLQIMAESLYHSKYFSLRLTA